MTKISKILEAQRTFFRTGQTRSVDYRKERLRQLQKHIKKNEDRICEAIYKDFKKPKFECLSTETQLVLSELKYMISHIGLWARPKKVPSVLANFPTRDWIQYEPFGEVLVISPWNYPFYLAISPIVGAVAAGNTVVLKPSELSPATSTIVSEIIEAVFDFGHVSVVQGGVDTSQELLEEKWDYIFFTGSTKVGKIIYKKAAESLTPVTLELGGKNPCIVDESCNLGVAAKRIVWGKFINAGQTCLAPDYILVNKNIKDKFIGALKKTIKEFYGKEMKASDHFARIATPAQYDRLKSMLNETQILLGGEYSDEDFYIAPTLVDEPKRDSTLMQEEIFGPILPIIGYENEDDIDSYINHYGKPLALYVFSDKKKFQKKIMGKYQFGGGAINDTLIQVSNKRLPFGGIGQSGFGNYHGRFSFELFSHKKSIVKKPTWIDFPLRYPPYNLSDWLGKKIKHLV